MNIDQAFPSKYIKAADLSGKPFQLLMGRVTTEKIGDDVRPVLHFQNAAKGLVLNRTNANAIDRMYGPETDNWFGQTITIFPDMTDFRGDRVDCIRVQFVAAQDPNMPGTLGQAPVSPPPFTAPPVTPPPAAAVPDGSLDDDIPF